MSTIYDGLTVTGAPGFRSLKDLYSTSRGIGLSYYPYSSVISGLTPSISFAAANPAATPANLTVAIGAGSAYLDSTISTLASSINVVINPSRDGAPVSGANSYGVFLSPTRILQPVAIGGSAPTTYLNGVAVSEGAQYATAVDYGDYFITTGFYSYNSGAWAAFDPSFFKVTVAASTNVGKSRTWGGNSLPTVTATNFTYNAVEKKIYIGNTYPPFVASNSKALLRDNASLRVATLTAFYHVLPVTVVAAFTNGSTTVTLSAASAATYGDLFSSVVATTTLAIDGSALAAAGYTAGVITLAAAYPGTTGAAKSVLISPVTVGNNYVLSTTQSKLEQTLNFTRQ